MKTTDKEYDDLVKECKLEIFDKIFANSSKYPPSVAVIALNHLSIEIVAQMGGMSSSELKDHYLKEVEEIMKEKK